MPYREIQESGERCGICGEPSVQKCRRCGNPVCQEHTSASGEGAPTSRAEGGARKDRAVEGVCLRCVKELEERIAAVERQHGRAKVTWLKMLAKELKTEDLFDYLQEIKIESDYSRRLRRLLRVFEEETPYKLARLRDFRRRRVTVGICITCGELAQQICLRCGTAMCRAHGINQEFSRCSRCERDFREEAGTEPDWVHHPLRALRYLRLRRRFLEHHPWDPEVYGE